MKLPGKGWILSVVVALLFAGPAWASQNSEAEADFTLGMKYYTGTGDVGQNLAKATEWFRKAAELGMPEAQYRLGQAYDSGQGAPRDYTVALRWYIKAAAQNDRDAESAIGDIYELGHGVKANTVQAAEWYYKAAEQGGAHAQAELGKFYFSGIGVKQDFVQAYFWLGLAAKEIDDAMDKRDEAGDHLTPDQLQAARQHIEQWHPSDRIEKKHEL